MPIPEKKKAIDSPPKIAAQYKTIEPIPDYKFKPDEVF